MKWEEHMLRCVTKVSAIMRLYNDFTWSNKVTVVLPKTPQFHSHTNIFGERKKEKPATNAALWLNPTKRQPFQLDTHAIHSTIKRSEIDQTTDNSSKEHTKLQMKANTVKARINGFCKHHMQKQLMTKCEQHVYESSSLLTPIFLQHASPTPWKTTQWTHMAPHQPPHGASNKILW